MMTVYHTLDRPVASRLARVHYASDVLLAGRLAKMHYAFGEDAPCSRHTSVGPFSD